MCNFFSCIVLETGELLFTEEDSHHLIIERAGLTDNSMVVMLEVPPPFDRVRVDAPAPAPCWYMSRQAEIELDVLALAARVGAVREATKKSRTMKRPQIGQRVKVSAILKRDTTEVDKRVWRVWRREPYRANYWAPYFNGYYIGWRTLANGQYHEGRAAYSFNFYDGDDFREPYLEAIWRTEAWLIVPNERQNPVRVHPDDCEIL